MNSVHLHVTRFNSFAFVILGIAAAAVAFMLLTTRRDEQVTREPIPGDGGAEAGGGEH
jgi:hypothetical protein